MAPKKRPSEEVEAAEAAAAVEVGPNRRVTRSLTRFSDGGGPVASPSPQKKKAKKGPALKKEKKKKEDSSSSGASSVVVTETEPAPQSTDGAASEAEAEASSSHKPRTIVIEHCKQCSRFKTRAAKVKAGLEVAVLGINVVLNPDKPRRGCFEIREEGGEIFISLLGMKRPFQPMMDLDMEQVIADITAKMQV